MKNKPIQHEETQQLKIICAVVFMSFLNASIAYPIFPPLFLKSGSSVLISPLWSETTKLLLLSLTLACFPFGQFLGLPILGKQSDIYGRKKVLLFCLVGSAIGYVMVIAAFKTHLLFLLLLGQFIAGFSDGTYTIAIAFASDFRSMNKFLSFGRINSIGSLGYIAGPLFGGFLSEKKICAHFSYDLPFIFALIAIVIIFFLVYWQLPNKSISTMPQHHIRLITQLNIIQQFKALFSNHPHFKYLLIISTLFTFSVDIFYEFSGIYLTGMWNMSSAMIAIYNIGLSLSLSLGSNYIPQYLSKHLTNVRIILYAMLFTAIIFNSLIMFQYPIPTFFFFSLIGLGIGTASTAQTIHLSNQANASIQGEVLGIQQSLRTLGDAFICITGGMAVIVSVTLPLLVSCIVALSAVFFFCRYQKSKLL